MIACTTCAFANIATLLKMIKEFMPGDVRVAGEANDMLVACCAGELCNTSSWIVKKHT